MRMGFDPWRKLKRDEGGSISHWRSVLGLAMPVWLPTEPLLSISTNVSSGKVRLYWSVYGCSKLTLNLWDSDRLGSWVVRMDKHRTDLSIQLPLLGIETVWCTKPDMGIIYSTKIHTPLYSSLYWTLTVSGPCLNGPGIKLWPHVWYDQT